MTSGAASRERDGALIDGHTPMFARRSMAMCAVGERLVLFGGVGAAGTESILDVANDCWIFDTTALTWREVVPREPWPSARRCVGVAPASTGLFLWGGSGVTREDGHTRYTFLNDWWHFDVDAHMWTERRESDDHRSAPSEETYPSPRYTPVFVRAEEQFLLFGGYTEDRLGHRKLNDAWIGDGRTWEPVPMQGVAGYERGAAWPGLRYGCMAAALGDCAFVFGGFSDDGDHNDLWQFSLSERLCSSWRRRRVGCTFCLHGTALHLRSTIDGCSCSAAVHGATLASASTISGSSIWTDTGGTACTATASRTATTPLPYLPWLPRQGCRVDSRLPLVSLGRRGRVRSRE